VRLGIGREAGLDHSSVTQAFNAAIFATLGISP
jgi:hypothetical protein